ncbi:MAG: ABC transporter permease [Dysgonamonadaceae bacterium]|nr:ABC transporter permease [Dysgonamonadaceae bacterium]
MIPHAKMLNSQCSILTAFVQKEFYHIFRDIRTVLVIIGIPVFQILIIGFAISTNVKDVKVAVFDPSNDEATNRIINRLNASEYFNVALRLNTISDAEREFKKGKTGLIVIFGENFGENLYHTGDAAVQLLVDASDPNHGQTVASYATGVISDYQRELLRETDIPVRINSEVRMLYNPEMRSAYNFVPGLMGLVFMLICAMMTSVAIVREKETGTMEVLLASPVKPVYIVISKLVPYFIISWFIFILILLLSVFVLDVPVTGSLLWLNVFTLLFIVVGLSLGLLISTIVKTQVAAILASGMGLIMPVMILSGYVFPIESMPPVLQWISGLVPARWFNEGAKKLIIEGAPVRSVLKEMSILLGMAVLILTVSLRNIKARLE